MLMQTHEARLTALRQELKRRDLDGFIVPISDEHMSEYVGGYAQRLAWLTGFGGSAGSAVVLQDTAAMFVDGRYTVQVRDQVDEKLFEYRSPLTSCNPADQCIGQQPASRLIRDLTRVRTSSAIKPCPADHQHSTGLT